MISPLFITGTDTDVGKTFVTTLLNRGFQELGINVITQKWVQCGNTDHTDIDTHDAFALHKPKPSLMPLRLPYLFEDPVSPHLANTEDPIDPNKLLETTTQLNTHHDLVLIEGAGGIRVPLSKNLNTTDLLEQGHIPCLLVVANKVGCINHSLLTIEALKLRQIPLLGFIISNPFPNTNPKAAKDNPIIIRELGKTPLLGEIPYAPDSEQQIQIAIQLAKRIQHELD